MQCNASRYTNKIYIKKLSLTFHKGFVKTFVIVKIRYEIWKKIDVEIGVVLQIMQYFFSLYGMKLRVE